MTLDTPDPTLHQVRNHMRRLGGYAAFARARGIAQRTAERIFSGARPAPAWLLDELEPRP